MRGKNPITIGIEQFAQGVSTSNNFSDGGFSPSTDQVNLTNTLGAMYQPASPVNASTNLTTTDKIIASCQDPSYGGNNRMLLSVGTSDYGTFYTVSTSNVLANKVTTSSAKFANGISQLIPWYDSSTASTNYYATTKAGSGGDVVQWDGNITKDETWFSATLAGSATLSATTAWRPLLVYETNLYVGDKNVLHRVTPDLTLSAILTLTVNETITALGLDKGTGLMLIATTQTGSNADGTYNSSSKVYLYDGLSNKASRVIPVEGLVTAFRSLDNATFAFFGNKFGIWTGNGIRFLRKLETTLASTSLTYPPKTTAIDNTLYFVENRKIMAYGELSGGTRKVFYPAFYNQLSSDNIDSISHLGSNVLGVAYEISSVNKFYTFDTSSVATAGGSDFYFNRLNFEKEVQLKELYVEMNESLADAASIGTFHAMDDTATNPTTVLTNSSGAAVYSMRIPLSFGDKRFRSVQPRIVGSANKGIKRMVLSFDVVE